MFSREICKIFKNNYFEEHLRTAASETLQYCQNKLPPEHQKLLLVIDDKFFNKKKKVFQNI